MSNENMSHLAKEVPTTIDELAACEIPQAVVKQYGERLVRCINAFIEQENLQKYIDARPKMKKQKIVAEAAANKNKDGNQIIIDVPDDEFEDDIDYSEVPIPSSQPIPPPAQQKSNPYAARKPAAKPAAKKPKAKPGAKLKSKKSSYF